VRRSYQEPLVEIIPIEIAPDKFVRIHGIDHDITQEQAEKICRVVMALVASPSPTQDAGGDK